MERKVTITVTGIRSSGKSTIAEVIYAALADRGCVCTMKDGRTVVENHDVCVRAANKNFRLDANVAIEVKD